MGGVGKTTLAKACYGRITSSNKGIKHCFIGSISEKCGKWHDVEGIANELYSRLLSEDSIDRQDLDISYRRGRLSRLRVFIVLDDVETPSQLEQILLGDVVMNPVELFARGSRIIVTTRNKRVLDYVKAMIYNVAGLDYIESIELFSLRAFRHLPPHNWKNLIRLAASYCAGNPLALTILGNTLFDQDQHYWRSFLSELKLIPNPNVHDILKRSYDKLGVEEKKIFLDVACLLHGISRSRLIAYMTTMYPSTYAKVKDLIDSSLLTCVSHENEEKIEVHDLLKEMAWNIVNEEPNLDKRSRLVDPDDVLNLLSASKVKKYWTYCLKVTHCPEMNSRVLEELDFKGTSLVELPNAIYNVKQDGVLRLYGENITKFPAITTNLKMYELSHTSIREIDLHDYHHHPASASSELVLPRFYELHLYGNSQLKSLPKSIWNMVSDALRIYGSPLIESLPQISEPLNAIQEWKQLTTIDLSCCKSLVSIPSSIHRLSKLLNLCLKACKSIRSLPELPPNLMNLDVSCCKSLQALPSNTGKLLHLESLKFDDCPQFDQTSLSGIVANFLPRASLVSDHKVYNKCYLCSRSDLPEWFTYKSINSKEDVFCCVKVELPLLHIDSGQSIIKAIAFGIVVYPQPYNYPRSLTCECKVGNTTVVASWNPQIQNQDIRESCSEKLWMVFSKNLLGDNHRAMEGEEEDEAWYVKYAGLVVSFEFYISGHKIAKIKTCGVSLVY
ncbi:Disease resistance protein RUN1 [Linum perenne]